MKFKVGSKVKLAGGDINKYWIGTIAEVIELHNVNGLTVRAVDHNGIERKLYVFKNEVILLEEDK